MCKNWRIWRWVDHTVGHSTLKMNHPVISRYFDTLKVWYRYRVVPRYNDIVTIWPVSGTLCAVYWSMALTSPRRLQDGREPGRGHDRVPARHLELHPLHVRHPARRLRLQRGEPAAGAQPEGVHQGGHLLPGAHHQQPLQQLHARVPQLGEGQCTGRARHGVCVRSLVSGQPRASYALGETFCAATRGYISIWWLANETNELY